MPQMGRWIAAGETEGYLPRKRIERNVQRARQLRDQLSLPEALLWRLLKGSPQGVHFRSQHPIGDYVLDFYCAKAKIAFEVDGIVHDMGDRPERNAARDAWLRGQGIEVVRIPAAEVLKSPETVAEGVMRYCRR
jgi:very-short-patch-repair endonuclease